jgi:hypothetical protein
MIELFRMRSEMSLFDTEHWRPHSDQTNLAFVRLTRMKFGRETAIRKRTVVHLWKGTRPLVSTYP